MVSLPSNLGESGLNDFSQTICHVFVHFTNRVWICGGHLCKKEIRCITALEYILSSNSPLIKQNSGVCLVQTTLETDITEQCREQQTTLPINIIIRWLKHLFLLLTRFACSPALRSLRKRYQPTVHFQKTCDGTIFNTASLDTEFRRSRSVCRSEHCTKPFSAKFKRTLQLVSS